MSEGNAGGKQLTRFLGKLLEFTHVADKTTLQIRTRTPKLVMRLIFDFDYLQLEATSRKFLTISYYIWSDNMDSNRAKMKVSATVGIWCRYWTASGDSRQKASARVAQFKAAWNDSQCAYEEPGTFLDASSAMQFLSPPPVSTAYALDFRSATLNTCS